MSTAISGKIGGKGFPYDVDCTHVSNCCCATVFVEGSGEGTNYYVCESCGFPCDIKEAED